MGGVSLLILRLNKALRGFDLGVWLGGPPSGEVPATSDGKCCDDFEKIRVERLEADVVGVVLAELVNSSAGGRSTSGLRQT